MQKHTVQLDSSTMLDLAERYVLHFVLYMLMWQRIFAAVKDSCERLQTDYVDVFQVCYRAWRCREKLMSSVIDSTMIHLYADATFNSGKHWPVDRRNYASSSWYRQRWSCEVYWDVIMLGLAVPAHAAWVPNTRAVIVLIDRIRHSEPIDSVHLDAELPQCHVQGGTSLSLGH